MPTAYGSYSRRKSKVAYFEIVGNEIHLHSDYDADLVDALKRDLPPAMRRWNPTGKYWIIGQGYAQQVALLLKSFGYDIVNAVDDSQLQDIQPVRINLRLNYLANLRRQANGEVYALGMDETGNWYYQLSADTLGAWFGFAPQDLEGNPAHARDYYEALGVGLQSDRVEIKRAYRSLARYWHPDVNKGAAAEQAFIALSEAYAVLSDDKKRRRYDVGRQLAGSRGAPIQAQVLWVPPDRWRCGLLTATVMLRGAWMAVNEIHSWGDILDADDRRLSVRFNDALQKVIYEWV